MSTLAQHNEKSSPLPTQPMPTQQTQVCRICLEKDLKSSLISPCKCKGSIKYVHAHCIASWRRSLSQTGRQRELYHCSLCRHKFLVRQHRPWAALLNYRAVRAAMTLIILITLLIPAGTLMKAFIHLSLQVANQPGGLSDLLTSGTLIKMFLSSIRKSTRRTVDVDLATPRRVLYTPFPVCFNSSTHTDTHALVSSNILYYFLFPFADERLWRLILCRLEHFHLGFFLLGSINNVWFTYKVLNDMFDIILAVQHHPEHGQEADIVNAVAAVAVATNNNARFERFTRSAGKIIKGFLLTYCCSLVVLFWIHFNLFAFHIDTHPNDAEEQTYSSRQFVAELPLWTFRWVTLGVAVGDFASRGIYNWLAQLTNCIDDEEVVSLPENKE